MLRIWRYLLHVILISLAMSVSNANAQGKFVLEKVFIVSEDRARPASWARDGNGYDVEFRVRYNSDRCVGNYRVKFVFDRDFQTLRDGEIFRIGVRKIFGTPPCGHKWTRASVLGANSFPLPNHPDVPARYQSNGNISVVQEGYVNMWDTNPVEATAVLEAKLKRDVPYTKISLVVGSSGGYHSLHLIYRYSAAGGAHSANNWEQGIDRMGQDFRNFDQAQPDPGICQAACANDPRCRAWTWVRPGHQGPHSRCWLKHGVPVARRSDCCVSGVRLLIKH